MVNTPIEKQVKFLLDTVLKTHISTESLMVIRSQMGSLGIWVPAALVKVFGTICQTENQKKALKTTT